MAQSDRNFDQSVTRYVHVLLRAKRIEGDRVMIRPLCVKAADPLIVAALTHERQFYRTPVYPPTNKSGTAGVEDEQARRMYAFQQVPAITIAVGAAPYCVVGVEIAAHDTVATNARSEALIGRIPPS